MQNDVRRNELELHASTSTRGFATNCPHSSNMPTFQIALVVLMANRSYGETNRQKVVALQL